LFVCLFGGSANSSGLSFQKQHTPVNSKGFRSLGHYFALESGEFPFWGYFGYILDFLKTQKEKTEEFDG